MTTAFADICVQFAHNYGALYCEIIVWIIMSDNHQGYFKCDYVVCWAFLYILYFELQEGRLWLFCVHMSQWFILKFMMGLTTNPHLGIDMMPPTNQIHPVGLSVSDQSVDAICPKVKYPLLGVMQPYFL